MSDKERREVVQKVMDWPLADQFYGMDLARAALHQAEVVARQRYAEMHDPGCAEEMIRRQQRTTSMGLFFPACDCWLSRCVLTDCDGTAAETGPRRVQQYTWKQEEGEWYDAPSIAITRECPRCKQSVQVCTKGHCMYCGMSTLADLR